MLRILLAIEDYGEMVFLQTLLKKLGFDIDYAQSQRAIKDKQLGFNPHLIIASAEGRKISGLEVAEKIQRRQGVPKVVLLCSPQLHREFANENKNLHSSNVDGTIETPVNAQVLLETIAQVGGLDSQMLIDKYTKMKSSLQINDNENNTTLLTKKENMNRGESSYQNKANLHSEERSRRYEHHLHQLPPAKQNNFSRETVMTKSRELRRNEDVVALKNLEQERRNFVSTLFLLKRKNS